MIGASIHEQHAGDTCIDVESYNAMVRACRKTGQFNFDPSFFVVQESSAQVFVSLRSTVVELPVKAFSVAISGTTANVEGGYIHIGDTNYEISSSYVTLTGGTEYVWAWHKKDHSDSGIDHSSSVPTSAGDTWKFLLVQCASPDSAVYSITKVHHDGDVILATPTL